MTQADKAAAFGALHIAGDPIILFNIWDAESAKRVEAAGAKAIATGSHAVAEVLGYSDGEGAPLDDMLWLLKRIVQVTALPVTHDMERGYASTPDEIAKNCARAIEAGAIGINIEDSFADVSLRGAAEHALVLKQVKAAMTEVCQGAWLNARTDVFRNRDLSEDEKIADTIARGEGYAEAGADSLFVPFTRNLESLSQVAAAVPIPINAMRLLDGPTLSEYAAAGIGRVSHGPFPYMAAYDAFDDAAKLVY